MISGLGSRISPVRVEELHFDRRTQSSHSRDRRSDTAIRIPQMQARPPITWGKSVIRPNTGPAWQFWDQQGSLQGGVPCQPALSRAA